MGLEKCWASSSANSSNNSMPIFVFLENKCPLDGIPWIKRIMETTDASIVNTKAISVIQFAFTTAQPKDSFYYHCKVIFINQKFLADNYLNSPRLCNLLMVLLVLLKASRAVKKVTHSVFFIIFKKFLKLLWFLKF